jgi:cellulose synthase/poly-beta-1,6-N-acetylglucosamine synthase-like glycosyltransferase
MSQIGVPIPLGGTTLFMRRDVLEKIGRWDAHNVTEDADLGIRLARFGYRTELSLTVTQEEATCRFRPWIRQRSRWLKGYMVTYLVHMRNPGTLLAQLGLARFVGLNVILLAALMQFLLAPILWCFWFLAFGFQEPLGLAGMSPHLIGVAMIVLGAATLLDFAIAALSMRGQNRRRLIPWVFAFVVYFPMATLAAYKALIELIFVPFFWDKTTHGQTKEGQTAKFSAVST